MFSSGQHSYNVTTLVAAMSVANRASFRGGDYQNSDHLLASLLRCHRSHVLLSALRKHGVDGRSKLEYFERALNEMFHSVHEDSATDRAAVAFKRECGIDLRY